ncbi:MAG: tetratricopeptide repeat protein, partial [Spirochaetota bacterium]
AKLRTSEIIYYEANLKLAQCAEKSGDPAKEEKYLFAAATSYLNRWNIPGYRSAVSRLIEYYEEAGADLEYSGKYPKATELYSRYVKLVTYLHWLKKYEDLYNEYGARAHVMYIDSFANDGTDLSAKCRELETRYSGDTLDVARMNFDKAHIYGLAYIYAKMGIENDRLRRNGSLAVTESKIIDSFISSQTQISWALFMDDAFTDPVLLQGWINQYIDLRRNELSAENKGMDLSRYNKAFSSYLWESNKDLYLKALAVNDEILFPEKEGSLHLNLGNTHFLLTNYPAALDEYRKAAQFKKSFGSKKEEALFRYHLGYCLWQNGEIAQARTEIIRVADIYRSMGGSSRASSAQIVIVYRYLALFDRMSKNWSGALSWYDALLAESRKHKISVDTARILLDMAYCREQMGDDEKAVSLCEKADTLLRSMDDDDPAFKMQIRLFGLFSFSVFDLGPDSVVIGDSRIFSSLSVAQKRLLALSTMERISLKRGEYARAQKYIKKKLSLLEDRDSSADIEAKIRALNSDGYCSFMRGRYPEARARFNDALTLASDEDVNNLSGIFASMMNIVELYAYTVENGKALLKDPEADLAELKMKIVSYRDNYEKARYSEEKETIEAAAKEQNAAVKQSDLDAVRQAIAADAAGVYADADLAAATVDFYIAEISAQKVSAAENPYETLLFQNELFKTYGSTSKVFEDAADTRIGLSSRAKAKLLVNAAVCRTRSGSYEKAYELFGRAEQCAKGALRDELLWDIYYREAVFLRDAGKSIDEDYLAISDSY